MELRCERNIFCSSFAASRTASPFISRLRKSIAVSCAAPIPDHLFLTLPIIPGLPVAKTLGPFLLRFPFHPFN